MVDAAEKSDSEESSIASSSATESDEHKVPSAEEDNTVRTEAPLQEVEWVLTNGGTRLHRRHPSKRSKDGWARPMCCSVSVKPDEGTGVREANRMGLNKATWCDRCAGDLACLFDQ